jgi:hypothetical protein
LVLRQQWALAYLAPLVRVSTPQQRLELPWLLVLHLALVRRQGRLLALLRLAAPRRRRAPPASLVSVIHR